jgi:uncharacterized membrane protein (DUF106 family)
MSILNTVLRGIVDVLLIPFAGLPPLVGIVVFSLLLGVAMLFIFKVTSNQAKIDEVKRKIHAGIFEIRLFNDDLRAIFRAQGEVMRHNFRYVGLSLVPMLWMLVPIVLLLAQLQFHWGYEGLEVGKPVMLRVELDEDWSQRVPGSAVTEEGRPSLALQAPDGLEVETPALWFPSRNEAAWRIRPTEPGRWNVAISLGDEVVTKSLDATGAIARRSPDRWAPSFGKQLLYPAEPSLPADLPIRAISVPYRDATVWFLGMHLHWIIPFFILSIVFAFALKDRFGVKI